MIVACPSCQTRYRHDAAPEPSVASGQCGACDESFPLTEARRSYVLLPGTLGALPRASIGMDDPTLADKLGTPGIERDTAPAPAGLGDPDSAETDAPMGSAAAAESAEAGPAGDEAGRSAASEILIAVLPTAAGAGLAYYLADLRGLDPITWTAVGGAVGLLLGWGCLLWKRPRD